MSQTLSKTEINNNHKSLVAVLTSDIVHSTKLSSEQYAQAIDELTELLKKVSDACDARFEIFRGDSFQLYFPDVKSSMKYTLAIRLFLLAGFRSKSISLTQSLAINTFTHLDKKPGTSSGKAFLISGRTLDQAKRGDLQICFPDEQQSVDLNLSTKFLHHLLSGLTNKQAGVLYYYVIRDFPEQKVIAELLDITRQNVATHLKRGGAELISAYLEAFETLFKGRNQ